MRNEALLVRFARRLANWEEPLPIEELQRREFKAKDGGPDLRVSVYEVANRAETVRACAEHCTGFDPPRTTLTIDVTDAAGTVRATEGNPNFSFVSDRHREVVLEDLDALHDFIGRLLSDLSARRSHVERMEIQAYARARLAADDPEWQSVAASDGSKSWVRKLLK